MKKLIDQIKNYIQLHTSEMEDGDYIDLMRELSLYCSDQADITEYRADSESDYVNEEI